MLINLETLQRVLLQNNSGLLQAGRDAPKKRRYPIFVTLSLWVECSLTGSHSILVLRPQIQDAFFLRELFFGWEWNYYCFCFLATRANQWKDLGKKSGEIEVIRKLKSFRIDTKPKKIKFSAYYNNNSSQSFKKQLHRKPKPSGDSPNPSSNKQNFPPQPKHSPL